MHECLTKVTDFLDYKLCSWKFFHQKYSTFVWMHYFNPLLGEVQLAFIHSAFVHSGEYTVRQYLAIEYPDVSSGVTHGVAEVRIVPAGKLNVKTRLPLDLFSFWFFRRFFAFFGVFSSVLGFQYSHPHPDSSSFLKFFSVCWSVGPLQLSTPLAQASSYATERELYMVIEKHHVACRNLICLLHLSVETDWNGVIWSIKRKSTVQLNFIFST